jgi:hypothetical protein
MSAPPQDVLEFEGFLGNSSYEAVPAGMAEDVVAHYRRRAHRLVAYRLLGVLVAGIIVGAVLFRFTRSLEVSAALAFAFVGVLGALQLRARDQGVPEVVARGIEPGEVRAEYGVDPTEPEEVVADGG